MKKLSLILIILYTVSSIAQQKTVSDTVARVATIQHKTNGNQVQFNADAPTLNQIAGAPKAFYTNYWEFGDGTYSKKNTPTKTYKNSGDYQVRLWATNNYDTGKPPTSRPKKIRIDKTNDDYQEQASMDQAIDLQRNREPVPEQDMVVIFKYKNTKDYPTNGKLYLFYNELKYNNPNFTITDTRTHHNEIILENDDLVYTSKHYNTVYYASAENQSVHDYVTSIDSTEKQNLPLTLEEAKSTYKDVSKLSFDNMQPNEERNVFYTLQTTPEMLKDTSAIISVRGVYIPDNNYDNHNVKDMEMEIVTSHDPNKMSSNATFLNYRLVRYKKPKFKIRFQNNGEGPATTIKLETDIPDMFDKATIEVLDMYPKVKICPKHEVAFSCLDTTYTAKQAIFTFKNIYLPGSQQKNVKVYDSTKGFVQYRIKFGKDFHKIKTKSRTAIIFDKNDPIITNYSTTRFLPGLSIGVKAGYNSFSDLGNSKSYFIGATISPYKSYKWYWQIELLNSFHQYDGQTNVTNTFVENTPVGFPYYERTTTTTTYDNIDWEIPILARYNINNYIGLGTGLQGMLSISEKNKNTTTTAYFEDEAGTFAVPNLSTTINEDNTSSSFTNFRTGILLEATAGFARIGPSVGARYVFSFKENYNYMQFYAIWKF
ncbi:PKD domain-containing protein [Olleya sp. YSTF-M6]|uniref:PKD domain-containing protein n=1 Tax=Olleya sediminilitoris TaxID=2795739 RepID=A0ABS1WIQ1_9FLAO|nr:PKD domain-containing protein [Olleya sediminilitoris]MBL7559015.1 PKD domain-containing protein [Olleya sediminilitoris]